MKSLKEQLIDKMMEIAGYEKRFVDLVKEETEFKEPYYYRYTMTKEQSDLFLKYCEEAYKKKYRLSNSLCKREASTFVGNYGLKIRQE